MNLLRAASTISLFTLASRITGLVRDVVIASVFGAGASFDAFNVAFRIPNLLRRLFGEGAFSQAFVPTLARARAADGDDGDAPPDRRRRDGAVPRPRRHLHRSASSPRRSSSG